MTQKTIKTFKEEIYSEPPKNNNITSKTDTFPNDNTWSLDELNSKNYDLENIGG